MNMPLWFSNLVFWSAQVALLVLAAALLVRFLRIREPRVLLVYWRAVLALSLLLPFLQPWHRPKPITMVVVSIPFEPIPSTAAPSPAVSQWHLPSLPFIASILGVAILVGIAVRLVIFALGLLKLRQLRKSSLPIASPSESFALLEAARTLVHARAEFRLSSQDSPVTFGFATPLILLPGRFQSLDPRFQFAIACHELLHVRRRDWAQHLGEELLRAVFRFHPAIAWLISSVRLAREQVVDLDVISLTQARKPYLEALLEFTNARAAIAAIPAPLFLAESQLVERIALMLKEVRMSRPRLVVSLTAMLCCLALVVFFGAWAFPLKAAPRTAHVTPDTGAAPILQRIAVKYHDFDRVTLNDAAISAEETRMNQLPRRLTVGGAYDQTKADDMKKLLEDFWSSRGVTVEVRSTLTPSSLSSRYAVLEFDVYKQTLLSGRLAGGVNGGISSGVGQGVRDAVAGGVSSGVNGGVNGRVNGARVIRSNSSQDIPNVDVSTIWTDTVKRGPMMRQVRGLGALVQVDGSSDWIARVTIPGAFAADLRPDEHATIQLRPNGNAPVDVRNGQIAGRVIRVSPGPSVDTRHVDIALDTSRQIGFGPSQADAVIDIEKLDNILQIGRPVQVTANSTASVFKIAHNGEEAERVEVKFGRASVNTIEVLSGLQPGDKVILSDMSDYANAQRIRLTDDKHLTKH